MAKKFGDWIVEEVLGKTTRCRCVCGTVKTVRNDTLRAGTSTNCGCVAHKGKGQGIRVPLPGKVGHWKVLRTEIVDGKRKALCRCVCGVEKHVDTYTLRKGTSTSCGCKRLTPERATAQATRHGHGKGTPTYTSWVNMVRRCTDPKDVGYEKYGGAGITVCKRWLTFENFLADMGERPDGMTLDRKNGSKGYSKGNCRWATPVEQAANRTSSLLTTKGRTQTLKAWAAELDVPVARLQRRLALGWSPFKVIHQPFQ